MNKKILLITLIIVLFTNLFYAQEYPKGILGLKWGDSKEKVKKVMLSQKGVELFKQFKGDQLFFGYGKLSERKVNGWSFYFYKNQMCFVGIEFNIDNMSENEMENDWKALTKILKEKYGSPTKDFTPYGAIWNIYANDNEYTISCGWKGSGDENYFSLKYLNANLSKMRKELLDKNASDSYNKNDF